jgi:hypothetical protein
MINKNYLEHDFEVYDGLECADHQCKKCNIIIWFNNDAEIGDPEYHIIEEIDNENIHNGKGSIGEGLKIKCEEWIIKNIVE